MTDLPPLHAPEIIDALNDAGVEYVVIGGFALAPHGVVRATKDVDIVPDPSAENLERLAHLLSDLEAEHFDLGDFRPEEFAAQPDLEGLSAGGNFVLRTRLGRLDVMQEVSGTRGYSALRASAVRHRIPGARSPAWFAGFTELISMKAAAGRLRDEADIADLMAARGGLQEDDG